MQCRECFLKLYVTDQSYLLPHRDTWILTSPAPVLTASAFSTTVVDIDWPFLALLIPVSVGVGQNPIPLTSTCRTHRRLLVRAATKIATATSASLVLSTKDGKGGRVVSIHSARIVAPGALRKALCRREDHSKRAHASFAG